MMLWQALHKDILLNFATSLSGGLRVPVTNEETEAEGGGVLLQGIWPDIPCWLEAPNSE